MAFSGNSRDNAHRAVVNSDFGNSIEAIRVKQIFVDPNEPLATATKMVSFDFLNPRIMSFDLDEVTHESSDVNLLTMVFDYDWMEMVKIGSIGTQNKPYSSIHDNIRAPGVSGAPSDIHPNSIDGAVGRPQGQGKNSGLGGALSNILGRGVSQLTSDVIGRAVQTVGGGGRFATALGGVASSAISGPIGGLVSGSAREIGAGLFSSTTGTTARASAAVIVDRSTAGGDSPSSTVSSSGAYAPYDPAKGGV
jgi:hypothetical protein